jgi:hypothetical protein
LNLIESKDHLRVSIKASIVQKFIDM